MRSPVILLLLLSALPAGFCPAQAPDPELVLWDYFGDAENVAKLASLLVPENPVTLRDQAIRDLGQTHHLDAVTPLEQMLADPDPALRTTAVLALAELPASVSNDLLASALSDRDPHVVIQILAVVRRDRRSQLLGKATALLDRQSPPVQAACLHTLTSLGVAVRPELLLKLLQSPQIQVRLQAARNAHLQTDLAALQDSLARMARDDPPAVRAAAIVALAKTSGDANARRITTALQAEDPRLRKAAVLAAGLAGRPDGVLTRLREDRSAMVRQAAARVAARLGLAQAAEDLLIMLISGMDEPVETALAGLVRIDDADVARKAAQIFNASLDAVDDASGARRDLLFSRISACGRLLARTGRGELIRDRVHRELQRRDLSDRLLIPIAEIAGDLGTDQTGRILTQKIKEGVYIGEQFLAGVTNVLFSDKVAEALVRALGQMGRVESAEMIDAMARTGKHHGRLEETVSGALRALARLEAAGLSPDTLNRLAVDIVANDQYAPQQAYQAAILAGRRKLPPAVAPLQKLATQRRRHPQAMAAAAWALEQITGQRPDLPDPIPLESDNWMLRRVRSDR